MLYGEVDLCHRRHDSRSLALFDVFSLYVI